MCVDGQSIKKREIGVNGIKGFRVSDLGTPNQPGESEEGGSLSLFYEGGGYMKTRLFHTSYMGFNNLDVIPDLNLFEILDLENFSPTYF